MTESIVTLPYDSCWEPLDWAKQYCPSYITNKASVKWADNVTTFSHEEQISYYFADEKDATIFALRWL